MSQCPCSSGKSLETCCLPFISGKASPSTAEALMRSRYTAYALHKIDYITKTHDPDSIHDFDPKTAKEWSESAEWLGLEIVATEKGTEQDDEGAVEFIAKFKIQGEETSHRELSLFVRKNGVWFYNDGKTVRIPVIRNNPKLGRNDPCHCGSGKKLKKCCG